MVMGPGRFYFKHNGVFTSCANLALAIVSARNMGVIGEVMIIYSELPADTIPSWCYWQNDYSFAVVSFHYGRVHVR